MSTVRGRIASIGPSNRVQLENPQRDMRMWFELAESVDTSDPALWTTDHDFKIKETS